MKLFEKKTQAKKIYIEITGYADMQSMFDYFNSDTLMPKSKYTSGYRNGTIMIFHDTSMLIFYHVDNVCTGIRCDQDYKSFDHMSINLPHENVVSAGAKK